ncbi:MAG: universal stress protein [Thermoplasmata archaeon]|nr:universal stress protein [Thermoplasmata archaeon]
MVKSILVAVDGSESNKVAVDTAIVYAKTFNASVTAICVFDIGNYGVLSQSAAVGSEQLLVDQMTESAMSYIREKIEGTGIDFRTKTVTGRPAEEIINESKGYDLVVCGTMGRTGLKRALIGSVAETVVRMAHCPVLVVREEE